MAADEEYQGEPTAGGELTAGDDFPTLMRQYRERAGLSQNGLADRAGRDPGTVNRLESGKRAPVNREMIEALAEVLGLATNERDRFLAAAGHLPADYAHVGLGDPDLRLVAEVLADPLLAGEARDEFRLAVRLAARRWRSVALFEGLRLFDPR